MSQVPGVDADLLAKWQVVLGEIGEITVAASVAPTVFEVLGVAAREIRASRLLQFFLDPDQPHGLGDLVLTALLDSRASLGADYHSPIEVEEVRREEVTGSDSRMDLLVLADEFVCCIENKLYAAVPNDLCSYRRHAEKLADGRDVYCVLLSLREAEDIAFDRTAGFKLVTYEDLFTRLEARLGPRVASANRYYLGVLLDFVESIRRLKEGSVRVSTELANYFAGHQREVIELVVRVEALKNDMRERVQTLLGSVDVKSAFPESELGVGMWRESPFALFDSAVFKSVPLSSGAKIDLGVRIGLNGWEFRVRAVGDATIGDVNRLLAGMGVTVVRHPDEVERLLIRETNFPFDSDLEDVADYTRSLLSRLVA